MTVDPEQVHTVIGAALDHHDNLPKSIPESLRDLIVQASFIPDWFDRGFAMVATRAFLRNPEIVLACLATGAIVEGFSTLISKSFRIRGRMIENGIRRLKQNNLHLLELFLPGGLEPGSDGWKLTLRIRLVHAQTRRLIRDSAEWDEATYGTPISAAHILLGAATFSGHLMQHVERLGGNFTAEEREAYVHIWRYAGLVMGIPDSIMFHDEASSCRVFEIGTLCEPAPDDDSIIMANSIINSTPIVLGITEPKARRAKAREFYRISRELIGDAKADQFKFPPRRRIPILPFIRLRYRLQVVMKTLFRSWVNRHDLGNFKIILESSDLGVLQHSYRLPTEFDDEHSRPW